MTVNNETTTNTAQGGGGKLGALASLIAIAVLLVCATWALNVWPFSDSTAKVLVDITEEGLEPAHIMAPPGKVSIVLTNTSALPHQIDVGGITSPTISPGETYELRLGQLLPSNYDLVDVSLPDHDWADGRLHVIYNAPPGPLPEGSHDLLH